jgi:hypothetical protein
MDQSQMPKPIIRRIALKASFAVRSAATYLQIVTLALAVHSGHRAEARSLEIPKDTIVPTDPLVGAPATGVFEVSLDGLATYKYPFGLHLGGQEFSRSLRYSTKAVIEMAQPE